MGGKVYPSKWTPLRREIERILADGAWHDLAQLLGQVERFVDPRMAARHWCRDYDRKTLTYGLERPPASEAIVGYERRALHAGAWSVVWDTVRSAAAYGRFEVEGPPRQRRVRLRAQKKATPAGVACAA